MLINLTKCRETENQTKIKYLSVIEIFQKSYLKYVEFPVDFNISTQCKQISVR